MDDQASYSVPAIDRALAVLELLAQSESGFSAFEIRRRLGLPKSSTHLILRTLEHRGFLQRNTQTHKYFFGLKLLSLSRGALENLNLREEAKPFLRELMQETRLVVHMAILEHTEAVIIVKVEPPGMGLNTTWLGRKLNVNCTGVGKALLAFLSEEELDAIARLKGFPKHNENTTTSIRVLKRELAQVRAQGFSLDDEEDEIGERCIGAPIPGCELPDCRRDQCGRQCTSNPQ